jgi:hypothetical protein
MKRFLFLVFVFVLTTCVGRVAFCQPGGPGGPRGGFGFGTNLLSLAQIDAVKKEIELLDEQAESLKKAGEEIRGQRSGDRPDFRNMSEQEREKAFAEIQARREKENAAANAKAAEILLPHQIKRLKEISLQLRGITALSDADVAKQLQLSDDQKKKLEEISRQNRERGRELFQSGDRDGLREKFDALRKEGEQKMLAVLTSEQKTSFEQLKGQPFKMPEGAFGRGPGRRGNR